MDHIIISLFSPVTTQTLYYSDVTEQTAAATARKGAEHQNNQRLDGAATTGSFGADESI